MVDHKLDHLTCMCWAMKKMMLPLAVLFVILSLLAQGLCHISPVEVFYVKPTVPATECPSGDSPCHSLQYYANHSNFTNNSRFLFLEGEHHLDSVVVISNVANLSLVGVSSGVEIQIICKAVPSGFCVEDFMGLNIENMTISNCAGPKNPAISLSTGSDVSLKHVIITSNNHALVATNVLGAFLVYDSNFFSPHSGHIYVNYSLCNGPSSLDFSRSKLEDTKLHIGVYCSDVAVLIDDSTLSGGLKMDYSVLTNSTVAVSNSLFSGEIVDISLCVNFDCVKNSDLQCYATFLDVTRSTFNFSGMHFNSLFADTENCTVLVEDSTFWGQSELIFASNSGHMVVNNTAFVSNNIGKDAAIYLLNAAVLFVNCTFENNTGGSVIGAEVSTVAFQGSNVFKNNFAFVGTGMQLTDRSYVYFEPHTNVLFEGNHADYVGGAIYTDSEPGDPCFYHLEKSSENTVQVNFVGNTAAFAGSSLYGDMSNCCESASCENFESVFNTSNTEAEPSAIASDPYKICLCEGDKLQPDCFLEFYNTQAFPGQVFPVRLAVVGRSFDGVLVGAVRGHPTYPPNAAVGPVRTQTSDKPVCENFNYSVNSTEEVVTFELIPERYFFKQATISNTKTLLTVIVDLLDCPPGFSMSSVTESCVCDPTFDYHQVECNINNQSFLRPANSWIGFINKSSTGVMFHPNCPIGYCLPHDVSITSNTSDSQCEPHRTGLLCGKCEGGYSLTLGEGKCEKCSNIYLVLILPMAVAGLFLVAVLFVLNLTVTEGSINGLIFYANVMAMNRTVRFSGEASYLYMFLAWLNLDLGVSTCLFDGMDSYAAIWLQFLFPVYLWVIILIIILFFRKFRYRGGGACMHGNAVKVLATLLLLSYTKLQRNVIAIFSSVSLNYSEGEVRYKWLYDANLEYFEGKHLYLGLAGIFVLVFFIIPYTLCLAFFQQLQACSGHRLFQWVNKLKPVFDSYAGPYKDKYRFWTGMLLAVRTLLIILFTINFESLVEINLLIILAVSCALLLANSNSAYKKWPYNYLESFFYLQLAIFAGAAFYVRSQGESITIVADTSIGLSLTVFLAVVGYHFFCCFLPLRRCCCRLVGYSGVEEEENSYVHERATWRGMIGQV